MITREALTRVPSAERDAWLDARLGLRELPEDAPLPRGCVPYLPCPVDVVLAALDGARVSREDVFVDVGSGLGRALLLAHFLTGARALGVEIQPELARASRAIAARLGAQVEILEGDASERVPPATVYFLYCPFGGARLERLLAKLAPGARVLAVDLPPLDLTLASRPRPELAIYFSRQRS